MIQGRREGVVKMSHNHAALGFPDSNGWMEPTLVCGRRRMEGRFLATKSNVVMANSCLIV